MLPAKHEGERHATVVIVARADLYGDGCYRWRWKCDCGLEGVTRLHIIRGGRACMKCNKRRRNYKVGDVVGTYRIVGASHDENPRKARDKREKLYEVTCLRCGMTATRRSGSISRATLGCQACVNKKQIWGLLLSLDEICALVGIKKSLVMHRVSVLRQTLEEAISTPVQKQNHSGVPVTTKECAVCHHELPLSAFHRDAARPNGHVSVCKACRKHRRHSTRVE